jgi:hypothetical protein
MADSEEGMLPEHPRAGIAHHHTHLLATLCLVAMDWAIGAGGFLFTKPAAVEAEGGVIEQGTTFGAQSCLRLMMIAAVTFHHGHDGLVFPLQALAAPQWR